MQSGSSASAGLGSPAPGLSGGHSSGLVDSAIDHFIIRNDFHAAFDACEKGLEILAKADEQEQSCILLYTKVSEQAAVQEAVRTWLHYSSNMSLSGYSSVAELYILHVLLPLGQTAEAKELLKDEVGQVAFTEDQRQTALTILENHDARKMNHSGPSPDPVPVEAEKMIIPQGSVVRKLNAVMRLLYRGLSLAGVTAWSRFIHRTAVLLFLLYLLLIRMDPALPSAYPWILRLYGLWQQMWNAMFGPYYRASS
ncbi:peroxisome assembly protein 26 isoform X2 [Pangasianodon hypophthalmus]|uniref:peroxisome assembly protein 26 isoform X2 n=1 Tax=Pangasianodon hypophthalmus TaxID=310915 RepID=UPI000F00C2E6|nr:peroxisome assembly protein 26 isoform X2 [Pangasianodon hypophthalmus]